ncbi:BlaI/MecI/CopY family transcriptional regulator [uncultured Dokdonia sp.]|jgi:BlaI family penicillinase repressor|uniref:BlaI/MecI/CopY family transcriptional regulator n=1 Tax=unclassified Dokdonia TaxID=2615033 RepID=UPI00261BE066|nr:BlaI/MecI/CopY family transcriptional regulator [uncultured Dokdonia sp.]
MKQLTKAEEEVMQLLWVAKKANVATLIDKMPEPKPAYNTISTIIRILENKGFVGHEKEGRGYLYYPLVTKEVYSNDSMHKMMDSYFNGSFKSMVSFFVKKNDVGVQDLEAILKEINKND